MRRLLGFLLLLTSLPLPLAAASSDLRLEYSELYDAYARVGQIEGQRYVRSKLRIEGAAVDKAPRPILLTVRTLERDIEIQVGSDDSFEAPISEALRKENPQIWTNIPAADRRVGFSAVLSVEAPGQREFTYRLLGEMRLELSNLLKQRGFLARFFSPDIRGARIEFEDKARHVAIVTTSEGDVQFASAADGSIRLPVSEGWIAQGAAVRLSAVPVRIELELDR